MFILLRQTFFAYIDVSNGSLVNYVPFQKQQKFD